MRSGRLQSPKDGRLKLPVPVIPPLESRITFSPLYIKVKQLSIHFVHCHLRIKDQVPIECRKKEGQRLLKGALQSDDGSDVA